MSSFPSTKGEKGLDPVDEDISTLDLQHVEKSKAAPVMFLSQHSAPIVVEVEMLEVQNQYLYCRKLQAMVGSNLTWLFKESALRCRKSALDGSMPNIVTQRNQAAVLQHAHYSEIVNHPGV